jgi:hypothetical protein
MSETVEERKWAIDYEKRKSALNDMLMVDLIEILSACEEKIWDEVKQYVITTILDNGLDLDGIK